MPSPSGTPDAARSGGGWVGNCLAWGARLPIGLKGRMTEKFLGRLARHAPGCEVDSNLGVSGGYCWRVPAYKTGLAFGSPATDPIERATLDLVKALCTQTDGFVDVGANHGLYTASVRSVRRDPEFRVLALEPDPELVDRLASNTRRNGLEVDVLPFAASAGRGKAAFLKNLTDDSSGSLCEHFAGIHRTQEIEVETVSLAEVVAERGLERALVKIDVEGAGELAWEGLLTGAERVMFMVMEIIGPEADVALPERISRQTGWFAYYIEDYTMRETQWSEFRYVDPFWNWLFCRVDPLTLQGMLPPMFRVVARKADGHAFVGRNPGSRASP